jgi:hypothetical protein
MKLIAQAQAAHITAIILPAPAILAAVVVNALPEKCKTVMVIVARKTGLQMAIAMTAPTNGTALRFT